MFKLTQYQQTEALVYTLLFLILFGYARNILLELPITGKNVLITTLLFSTWYILTKSTNNFIHYIK
jgi:hypothetical protein